MKLKLNPDQRLIKKLNDLPSFDRRSYIARLSSQAINNIVAYVASSTKWNYDSHKNQDYWSNEHLNLSINYDHETDTLHVHNFNYRELKESQEVYL